MKNKALVVYVTTPHGKIAKDVALAILKARAAACVNAVPVKSAYWWRGKIESGRELLLIIKTEYRQLKKLSEIIRRHHPYDVPEIIALPIVYGYKPYLDWIHHETK